MKFSSKPTDLLAVKYPNEEKAKKLTKLQLHLDHVILNL